MNYTLYTAHMLADTQVHNRQPNIAKNRRGFKYENIFFGWKKHFCNYCS